MEEENQPRAGAVAALAIAILVGGLWALFHNAANQDDLRALAHRDFAFIAGTIIADALFASLIALGAIYLIFLRGRRAGRTARYFGYLVGGMLLISGGGYAALVLYASGQPGDMGVEKREAARVMQALSDPSLPPIDMHIYGKGDAAILERDFKEYAVQVQTAAKSYRALLASSGYGHMLGAANLAKPRGVKATQEALVALRAGLADFRGSIKTLTAAMKARIAKENIANYEKEDFLRGFNEAQARDQPVSDRLFDAQDKTFADLQTTFDVLARSRRRWSVVGGKLLFTNAADRDAFNAAVTADEQARLALRATSRQSLHSP
jgi:hypothetical protein